MEALSSAEQSYQKVLKQQQQQQPKQQQKSVSGTESKEGKSAIIIRLHPLHARFTLELIVDFLSYSSSRTI